MALQALFIVLFRRLAGCVLMRVMTGRTQQLLPGLDEAFRLYEADWLITYDFRVFPRDLTLFDGVLATMTSSTYLNLIRRKPWSLFKTRVRISRIPGLHHIRVARGSGMATFAADIRDEIDQMVVFNPP